MRLSVIFLLTIHSAMLIAQVEIPRSPHNCKIFTKNNFTYCLNEINYKTQWTATQIKGSDIHSKVYIPPDIEFFKDIPTSISSIWQKIEMQTKFWAIEFDSVFVVTGITEMEQDSTLLKSYYKAILKGCKGDAIAFIVDSKATNTNIKSYGININELEKLTRIIFFPSLDQDLQNIFKEAFNWQFWPIIVE